MHLEGEQPQLQGLSITSPSQHPFCVPSSPCSSTVLQCSHGPDVGESSAFCDEPCRHASTLEFVIASMHLYLMYCRWRESASGRIAASSHLDRSTLERSFSELHRPPHPLPASQLPQQLLHPCHPHSSRNSSFILNPHSYPMLKLRSSSSSSSSSNIRAISIPQIIRQIHHCSSSSMGRMTMTVQWMTRMTRSNCLWTRP